MNAQSPDIAHFLFREQQEYSADDLTRANVALTTLGQGDAVTTDDSEGKPETSAIDIEQLIRYLLRLQINRTSIFTIGKGSSGTITESNTYQFNFVGILTVGPYLFAVLPKYYRGVAPENIIGHGPEVLEEFATIMGAIRQYNADPAHKHDTIGFDYEASVDNSDGNLIDLYRFLLNDYAENGLYQSTRRITELNGYGEIDWNRTVNQIMPMRTASRKPVYVDVISTRSTADTTTIIRTIQAAVITDISHYLESSGLNTLFRLPTAEPSPKTLAEIGNADQLLRLLWKELRVQFVTRKRLLLRALIQYLEVRSSGQSMPLLAQGTCSFNLVWEDVCKRLFNDEEELHKTDKQLWKYVEPLAWAATSPEPSEKHLIDAETSENDADTQSAESSPLEPDVVARDKNDTKRYIIDAKYYIPNYAPITPPKQQKKQEDKPKGRVTRSPGLKDLIKQYFYLMALMPSEVESSQEASKTVVPIAGNAFVMPGQIPLIPDAEDGDAKTGTTTKSPKTIEHIPMRADRKLLTRRGATYLPFMQQHLEKIYGKSVPWTIAVFEMDPEQALRLYQSEDGTSHKQGLNRLKTMFRK
ncbi:LlaJI family restriction endonuclease [Bifidobacterium saguinibicoloris]|uniref:LlaJI family restriction endonuclease n=1 Tax=Bifidobacterium saguinibicoloris TaxID=2834433 RepID=UPI001C57A888|nr:LlaJI family restriction endonuclease [Bifidobacterium saguinibicoloris]MBW3081738.1 LlaJI family restriction endonuclease [Bifidobacterium saguinibicoloris]